jgi:tRNA A-37 threonylcarbamoyl transferase component Bud32
VDIERPDELIAYLRASGRIAADDLPVCRLLDGGVSNRTVLLERGGRGDWVLKQALEQLRVAVDWRSDPVRVHREAAGMRALGELLPRGAVPELLFEDHAHHLLAMTAVPTPHANWRDELLAERIESALVREFGLLLALMHRGSHERAGAFASAFDDRSFFESLRLEPYYAYSAERMPEAAPFLTRLIADCRATRLSLVHGDYSPKNVLVREGRLVLLDHEVIHWGDPAFDLGFALTHLLSKANHLPRSRQRFAQAAQTFWTAWRTNAGPLATPALEERAVRHTLACLLARIVGRSPLGYLSEDARARQLSITLRLMAALPAHLPLLSDSFIAALDGAARADHR